jgi:hypothetical protein
VYLAVAVVPPSASCIWWVSTFSGSSSANARPSTNVDATHVAKAPRTGCSYWSGKSRPSISDLRATEMSQGALHTRAPWPSRQSHHSARAAHPGPNGACPTTWSDLWLL